MRPKSRQLEKNSPRKKFKNPMKKKSERDSVIWRMMKSPRESRRCSPRLRNSQKNHKDQVGARALQRDITPLVGAVICKLPKGC